VVDIKLLRDTLTSNKSQNVYKADCPTLKIDSTAKSRYLSIHVYKFSISPAVVAKRAGLSYKLFFDNFLFWPRKFGPANFFMVIRPASGIFGGYSAGRIFCGRFVGIVVDLFPADFQPCCETKNRPIQVCLKGGH